MQIESDWLRAGFSTVLLSFRASEFSPRYTLASQRPSCDSRFFSSSRTQLVRPSMFDQRETNNNVALHPIRAMLPPFLEFFAGAVFRGAERGIIEKFQWSFGFVQSD